MVSLTQRPWSWYHGGDTHDELARLREQLDVLLGAEVLDDMVRVLRQVAAETERACVQLSVDVRHEQLDGRVVVEARDDLTSAEGLRELAYNIGIPRGRLDKVVVAVLHEAEVLVQNADNVAATLGCVAPDSAGQHQIRVAVLVFSS